MELPFHDRRTHYSQKLIDTNLSFPIGPTKLPSFEWTIRNLTFYAFLELTNRVAGSAWIFR